MKHIVLLLIICVATVMPRGFAARYHAPSDTLKANELLADSRLRSDDALANISAAASMLVGTPFAEVTKTDADGGDLLRLDAFDRLGFVNMVIALAKTGTIRHDLRWKDLAEAYEKVAYRRGENTGFQSKLIYGADWSLDNKSRGNIKEMTENYSTLFKTKSLDKVTRNRSEYQAMNDSAVYEAQRMVEMGFRTHKIPHLKREALDYKDINSEVRDGDIVMILSNDPDTDIFEIGFVVRRDDGLHLIYASEADGRVVESSETISRFIKRNVKQVYGLRWFRLEK